METRNRNLTKGFTIIEVLIVLAIAGLIMAIVFLAVPALQRNSRNNSRTNDAAHLAGLVNDYAANHAGVLPTGVIPDGPGPNDDLDLTNENWAIFTDPVDGSFIPAPAETFGTLTAMNVNLNLRCDSATNDLIPQARAFSISYQVETAGAPQNKCIQG
jgi:prepilin-type N-terminal cleavage/methylation domain-containing protein